MFMFTCVLFRFLMAWSVFHIIQDGAAPIGFLTSSSSSSTSSASTATSTSSENRLYDILGAISFLVKSRLSLDEDRDDDDEPQHEDWYGDLVVQLEREGWKKPTTEDHNGGNRTDDGRTRRTDNETGTGHNDNDSHIPQANKAQLDLSTLSEQNTPSGIGNATNATDATNGTDQNAVASINMVRQYTRNKENDKVSADKTSQANADKTHAADVSPTHRSR
jgi:hypothetical protein